ncbi:MAG: hypothetical protein CM15mV8_1420 [Caudoviricetes sp.]|nr:MAG: hypothetical protein CM15mV8_1420 [Caudoviricetes sp.]
MIKTLTINFQILKYDKENIIYNRLLQKENFIDQSEIDKYVIV